MQQRSTKISGSKYKLLDTIYSFENRSGVAAFTHINRKEVASGLRERVENPWKINQGAAGLCGPASLVYSIAKDQPDVYVNMVIELYEKGQTTFGKWKLKPGKDLKNYLPVGVPVVDWIPTASIRDSENWFYDYQDTSGEGGNWGKEMIPWLKKAGYTKIIEDYGDMKTKDEKSLQYADSCYNLGFNVMLSIHADILYRKTGLKSSPNHWVCLASRVNYAGAIDDYLSRTVNMTIFTWGELHPVPKAPATLKLTDFLDSYFGFIGFKY